MIAPGNVFARSFRVLILSQLVSPTSEKLSLSCGSNTIDDGCSISDDCSAVKCKMEFVEKPITYKLKVNKCDDPVSVTASMDVPDLYISWSHTYTSDDIVEVPGFTSSVPGFFSAGVYVQVSLTPDSDRLRLKVKLLAGGKIFGKSIYPIKATVMEGSLPIKTDACGFFGWWYELNDTARGAVIGGLVLLIIFMISSCCCCCCCCGCCGSRPSNQRTIVVQPTAGVASTVMATTTNVTLPMRPMVNGF